MTEKRTKTMKISGDVDYAKVPDRIKEFRSDCPNGMIETTPTITDGQVMFKARVIKDKSDPNSAEAIAHSLGDIGKKVKDFEKQETIAVGRALAMLGYMASGEVASSEEMAEFQRYQKAQEEEAVKDAIERIKDAQDIETLKAVFMGLGTLMTNVEVVAAKDERKKELSNAD